MIVKLKINQTLVAFFLVALFAACTTEEQDISQVPVGKVENMPELPQPYKQLDWKEKAIKFDQYVFDFDQKGDYMPLIWLDSTKRNLNQLTFGLYTAIGDVRQGPKAHIDFHESVTSIAALMSAGLSGIDKTNQNGYNYVKMAQNYFNSDTGWDIIMNNTNPDVAMLGGGYGRAWWYDIYPNLLFYGLNDIFPNVQGSVDIQRSIADQFYRADSLLDGNYHYSYFDYRQMKGMKNQFPNEEDAAAGHAYVLYSAYQKFGDQKYLDGAKSSVEALLNQKESRFYEVLLPFGAYVAARINAENDTSYDVLKLLNWTFDGSKAEDGRPGWGVISDKWGHYDVHGLQGSITDGGGYGFLMNTQSMAWPLVAMVRYQPQFARSIGKWMLNASNSSRLFYPYEIDDNHQWLPELRKITKNVIAYEGLRKKDVYGKESLKGVEPVALGDAPNWAEGQPDEAMFSLYSSAYSGIFGSIISETNVDKILKLDCLATDFYRQPAYPTYLYYNPYGEPKNMLYKTESHKSVDLYNAITHTMVSKDLNTSGNFELLPKEAAIIVEIPHNSEITRRDGKYWCNEIIVAYF